MYAHILNLGSEPQSEPIFNPESGSIFNPESGPIFNPEPEPIFDPEPALIFNPGLEPNARGPSPLACDSLMHSRTHLRMHSGDHNWWVPLRLLRSLDVSQQGAVGQSGAVRPQRCVSTSKVP